MVVAFIHYGLLCQPTSFDLLSTLCVVFCVVLTLLP